MKTTESSGSIVSPNNRINRRMREASGSQSSRDRWVSLLYLLARDHLPVGSLEILVSQVESINDAQFTNGWLALWAKNAAKRLHPPE